VSGKGEIHRLFPESYYSSVMLPPGGPLDSSNSLGSFLDACCAPIRGQKKRREYLLFVILRGAFLAAFDLKKDGAPAGKTLLYLGLDDLVGSVFGVAFFVSSRS
jgi:hypothetical protein